MLITDTLLRKKKELQPLYDDRLELFVCGPTVYDDTHIGHARTYVAFDVIARYLRYHGYNLRYIQNITDVDDKIINRAVKEQTDAITIARRFEARYHEDMQALRIAEEAIEYARASDYIPQIIDQIQRLIDRNHAYSVDDGSVYFAVPSFTDYGKLSHQDITQITEAVRIEKDKRKQHPADFVLWRGRPDPATGEPIWEAPWGKGRPGWHIEDTAITEKEFGARYDLHGGARDLLFPHHEAEIAQMETVSGQQPLVNYWLHTGLLNIRGEKMSKSEGNIITVRSLLEYYRPEALRLVILQAHYRSPMDYHKDDVQAASEGIQRIGELRDRLQSLSFTPIVASEISPVADNDPVVNAMEEAMDDDFQTPRALAIFFDWIRKTNEQLDTTNPLPKTAEQLVGVLQWVDDLFGIVPPSDVIDIPDDIQQLVNEREETRATGDWERADALREQIRAQGFDIRDTSHGPEIRKQQ